MKEKLNPLHRVDDNVINSLYVSGLFALYNRRRTVDIDLLMLGIIANGKCIVARLLDSVGVDRKKLLSRFHSVNLDLGKVEADILDRVHKLKLTREVREILMEAFSIAGELKHVYIGTEHVFMAALKRKSKVARQLEKLGMTYVTFRRLLKDFASYPPGILSEKGGDKSISTKVLELFGDELVYMAKTGRLDPLIGRERELNQVIKVLSRRKKNNPLIVGEPGVGKTSIIYGLAHMVASGVVPSSMRDIKIYRINVGRVIAGSKMRGDVEEKMMAIMKAAKESDNVILFFDDIHTLLGGGAMGGPTDIVSILKPELTEGDIRCIGVTTTSGYRMIFEGDPAFNRRFKPIFIEEPSVTDAEVILKKVAQLLSKHHGVKITEEAITAAVRLSKRYITERKLPDKAIDVLDEAAATVKLNVEKHVDITDLEKKYKNIVMAKNSAVRDGDMEGARRLRKLAQQIKSELEFVKAVKNKGADDMRVVTADIVKQVVSDWTNIPITTLSIEEITVLKKLDKILGERIIGQKEAVKRVAAAVKRGRTGVTDVDRPWASFLFLGPTGVGKSELARLLARELFGNEKRLIQIDMSELMEMHSVSKLIGSPPGYVGYQKGGQLTEKVRENPYSVVLFDEIEKAHPDVLNILLQILEYGQLTDAKGNTVSFRNTIIILTSNIGLEEIRMGKGIGFKGASFSGDKFDYDTIKDKLLTSLREYLRPELLNRLDDIIVFRPLSKKEVSRIVDILVAELNHRLKERHIMVQLMPAAKRFIIKEGFDMQYGARPLRRAIQRYVENVVADWLLDHSKVQSASGTYRLSLNKEKGKSWLKVVKAVKQREDKSNKSTN